MRLQGSGHGQGHILLLLHRGLALCRLRCKLGKRFRRRHCGLARGVQVVPEVPHGHGDASPDRPRPLTSWFSTTWETFFTFAVRTTSSAPRRPAAAAPGAPTCQGGRGPSGRAASGGRNEQLPGRGRRPKAGTPWGAPAAARGTRARSRGRERGGREAPPVGAAGRAVQGGTGRGAASGRPGRGAASGRPARLRPR